MMGLWHCFELLPPCLEAVPYARSAEHMRCKSNLRPHRSEPGGRFLYILSGALTTYSIEESQAGAEKAPVPPCILPVEDGTSQVSLEVDDRRAPHSFVLHSGSVKAQILSSEATCAALHPARLRRYAADGAGG